MKIPLHFVTVEISRPAKQPDKRLHVSLGRFYVHRRVVASVGRLAAAVAITAIMVGLTAALIFGVSHP